MSDYTVRLTLVVKEDSPEEAQAAAERVLLQQVMSWFVDSPSEAPFPSGTLLWYGFRVVGHDGDKASRTMSSGVE